jgi:hypothetical protein
MSEKSKKQFEFDGFASCYHCRKRKCRFRKIRSLGETVDGQGYNTSENAANNAEEICYYLKALRLTCKT